MLGRGSHARGKAPAAPFERIALSPFAKRLLGVSGTTMSIVDVEAARDGRASVLETIETGHGALSALVYSSDGLRALTGGRDGRLRLWRFGLGGGAATARVGVWASLGSEEREHKFAHHRNEKFAITLRL